MLDTEKYQAELARLKQQYEGAWRSARAWSWGFSPICRRSSGSIWRIVLLIM